jgi:hypothetical protein
MLAALGESLTYRILPYCELSESRLVSLQWVCRSSLPNLKSPARFLAWLPDLGSMAIIKVIKMMYSTYRRALVQKDNLWVSD